MTTTCRCAECRYVKHEILRVSGWMGCMKVKSTYDVAGDRMLRDYSCFKPIGWMDEHEKETERVKENHASMPTMQVRGHRTT